MGKFCDLTGKQFGKLTDIRLAGKTSRGVLKWECLCSCGKRTTVCGSSLKNGDTKSCGCYNREVSTKRIVDLQKAKGSDGRSKTRLYRVWIGMRNRCNNPKNYSYANYGGRGIRVCSEWEKSYDTFYSWAILNGYHEGLSIDRRDNDGDYSPENCQWVTWKEQHRNQRVSRKVAFCGKSQTLIEWSEETGISHGVLSARLRAGWSIEQALTEPVHKHKK